MALRGGHLSTAGRLVLATRILDDVPYEVSCHWKILKY